MAPSGHVMIQVSMRKLEFMPSLVDAEGSCTIKALQFTVDKHYSERSRHHYF